MQFPEGFVENKEEKSFLASFKCKVKLLSQSLKESQLSFADILIHLGGGKS